MLTIVDKPMSYLIALVPTSLYGKIVGSTINPITGQAEPIVLDSVLEGALIPIPIPLTAPIDFTTRITGFIETNHILSSNILTQEVSNALSNQAQTTGDVQIESANSTLTFQTKGETTLQLDLLTTLKNKANFAFDGLLALASDKLFNVRFAYIGLGTYATGLILTNSVKYAPTSNLRYTLLFRQPERGVTVTTPKAQPTVVGVT